MDLDPRLDASSDFILDLALCQVRLSHNACFPWILLIPRHVGLCEVIDLTHTDRLILMEEIATASHVMKDVFAPDKLNVATLGNIVPQLHIHVIARFQKDHAWPNPVWNTTSKNYDPMEKERTINRIKKSFERNPA